MRFKSLCTLVLACFVFSCAKNTISLQLKDALIIENIKVISPEHDSIPETATVIIQGDSILYVGPGNIKLQGTYQKIDGTGKYLIPGLIDSHVHVTMVNGLTFEHESKNPGLVKEYEEQLPKSYLYFGFTTLIDLTAIDTGKMERFNKSTLRPDLYKVGSPAVLANGYPMSYLPKEIRFNMFPNFLYIPSEASSIPPAFTAEDHSPEAVVARIKKSGAIAVKTFYETGFDQRGLPVPTDELLNELKKQAHKQNLILTAHGNSLQAHKALAKAGVDIIAHGLWNWDQYDQNDTLPLQIKNVLDQEIEKNIGYTPTLQVIEGIKSMAVPEFLKDVQLRYVLPAQLIKWYGSLEGQEYAVSFKGERNDDQIINNISRVAAHGRSVLKYISDHNGRILFGSDTPSSPTYGNPPGYNGYMEIQQMFRAGVPLREIFLSLTIENARAFKLEKQYGTVHKGKVANLLILNKNPLTDVSAYDAIQTVIIRGKAVPRGTLSAINTVR